MYLGLIGAFLRFVLDIEAGEYVMELGGAWYVCKYACMHACRGSCRSLPNHCVRRILGGQINLYRRINQLYEKEGKEPPLHAWWAALPPPFDLIVGLRQVHFLARYWNQRRSEEWQTDPVAEELFPFISSPRFTLQEFVLTPSNWFWFTKDAPRLDKAFLQSNKD